MSAIYADLKHLVRELVEQSKEARDDIVLKASEKIEQVCMYGTAVKQQAACPRPRPRQ